MQAVVPAAGEGTRLRPLTAERPKGLVEVAGKPLLTHVFEALSPLGVEEIVVVVGYHGDAIREHYGDSVDGVPLTYATQDRRRGLAHALLQAEPHVDGDVVVHRAALVIGPRRLIVSVRFVGVSGTAGEGERYRPASESQKLSSPHALGPQSSLSIIIFWVRTVTPSYDFRRRK